MPALDIGCRDRLPRSGPGRQWRLGPAEPARFWSSAADQHNRGVQRGGSGGAETAHRLETGGRDDGELAGGQGAELPGPAAAELSGESQRLAAPTPYRLFYVNPSCRWYRRLPTAVWGEAGAIAGQRGRDARTQDWRCCGPGALRDPPTKRQRRGPLSARPPGAKIASSSVQTRAVPKRRRRPQVATALADPYRRLGGIQEPAQMR